MWVLLDQALSESRRKKIYFKEWAGTGPVTTDDLNEAHRFDSEEEARMSAAYRYSLSFFEVVGVVVTVKSRAI